MTIATQETMLLEYVIAYLQQEYEHYAPLLPYSVSQWMARDIRQVVTEALNAYEGGAR